MALGGDNGGSQSAVHRGGGATTFVFIFLSFFLSFFLLRRVDSQVLLYFAGHVSYMELVYFNYDYNMKLCTLVTGAKFAMWLRVVYRSPRTFLMRPSPFASRRHPRSPHPHRARAVQLFVSLSLMGLLELFDFPPVFSYFDAHALWHACTPVIEARSQP